MEGRAREGCHRSIPRSGLPGSDGWTLWPGQACRTQGRGGPEGGVRATGDSGNGGQWTPPGQGTVEAGVARLRGKGTAFCIESGLHGKNILNFISCILYTSFSFTPQD